jgi:pimeloyl-ACP methyl ester carboxylesterase
VRIAYACSGNGVPVVRAARFISHLDYDLVCLTEGPIQQALARRHRLIRFDQRGQGLSDRHVGAGTLDDSVSDLRAVVDAAGLSRFVLWSIGGGAASAIRFAARYPERVERLIISAGWARGMAVRKDPRWIDAGEATMKMYEVFWNDPHSDVRRLGGFARQYPVLTVEQRRSYDQMLREACSGFSAESALRASMFFDVTNELGGVRCPTLVTRSQRDLVTPFEEVRLLVAGIPRARLVTLDSDNHMPLPQEPAFNVLVDAIEGFIGESELIDGSRQTTA